MQLLKSNVRRYAILFLAMVLVVPLSQGRPNIIVIFTDDWGYGDLGVFGELDDVLTPHLDALAAGGVLFADAYVTAPQCAPSRAGLLTGRYQQRFGYDTIPDGPLPSEEKTMGDYMQAEGYVTGMVGKWHLEPNATCLRWARERDSSVLVTKGRIKVSHEMTLPYLPGACGFEEYFQGQRNRYWSNFNLAGEDLKAGGEWVTDTRFRVDVQTEGALAFIDRNKREPFLLYLGYFAPHVPLEATEKYLSRFPGEMPERRRTGLALISAVDDGVGAIMAKLRAEGIAENTLVVFTSDNGAPLGAQQGEPMADVLPVIKAGPAWDGSRNDPLAGEKGMLAEGGIRVPMIWSWPARLPEGLRVDEAVSSLDILPTMLAAAGSKKAFDVLDGVNLLPWLTGEVEAAPKRALYWRFWNQAAIRDGDWKYIYLSDEREYLFDLGDDVSEEVNLILKKPGVGKRLKGKLSDWTEGLEPVGLPSRRLNNQELPWYRYYFGE